MPLTEMLTDEQAALIWSGQSSSIASLTETEPKEEIVESAEEKEKAAKLAADAKKHFTDEDITNVFAGTYTAEEDDEGEEESEEEKPPKENKEDRGEEGKQRGRKTSDLVTMVNQLVKEELLAGFENDNGDVEDIKTIEEAKELIKLNLEEREKGNENKWWDSKIKSYSPQIQAILHYAENGGHDVTPLLSAIGQVEQANEFDIETTDGQIAIIKEALSVRGHDEDDINEQIETLKDLDKLKVKAEKYLPELNNLKEQRVQRLLAEQMERNREAQEASRVYLKTIEDTLKSDEIKVSRDVKAKIFDALAVPRHTSLSGVPTNAFVKTLEDLQFGKNQDYKHFLDIVHFAIDKKSFVDKLKNDLKNEVTAEQVKKLKTAKSNVANTEQEFNSKPNKKTIQRSGFRNPFD